MILKNNVFIFLALALITFLGMFLDVFLVDAAQYASMSYEMLKNENYLMLYHHSQDYLDKPPLLFWLTSLSFKLFGVSNFTYRLPSVLFAFLGIYATYGLAKHLYNKRTGVLAAMILMSCQATFLNNHDVKTDTLLIGNIALALWQWHLFLCNHKIKHLLFGSLGVGLAMLAKGPMGLMLPVLCLVCHLLYTKNLKILFKWQWFLAIFIIFIVLVPMSYGLYKQFGWKGLKFYYWTQSFGRITGGNTVWRDDTSIFFFVHTFLWAFLPWTFVGFFAIFKNLHNLFYKKTKEIFTLGGIVLAFVVLSLSKFKLPHYIFVTFPLIAIITANSIFKISENPKISRIFLKIHFVLISFLWILLGFLAVFVFKFPSFIKILTLCILFFGSFYFTTKKHALLQRLIYPLIFTIVGVNFFLNTHFYPELTKYQGGSVLAKKILKSNVNIQKIYHYKKIDEPFCFYLRKPTIQGFNISQIKAKQKPFYIFTSSAHIGELKNAKIPFEIKFVVDDFHISMLTLPFLNPRTRAETLEKMYLLKIKP